MSNVARLRYAHLMGQGINKALPDLDSSLPKQSMQQGAGPPQGSVVPELHGHAHAKTSSW